jgi:hypothetical protein
VFSVHDDASGLARSFAALLVRRDSARHPLPAFMF